jgi:hypothetical protein
LGHWCFGCNYWSSNGRDRVAVGGLG